MSVTVRVPPVFRTMTSGSAQVDVEGGTVGEVLAALESRHPGSRTSCSTTTASSCATSTCSSTTTTSASWTGSTPRCPTAARVSIMQAVAGG